MFFVLPAQAPGVISLDLTLVQHDIMSMTYLRPLHFADIQELFLYYGILGCHDGSEVLITETNFILDLL